MKALINFKICDNAPECSGIAVCPNNAMYYDEKKKTIVVDDNKCTSCGACERECPVGAILIAKSEKQYQQYIDEIDKDPRTIKDLFIDRYGAASLSEFFRINNEELENKINNEIITMIEVFDENEAQCLLKSIPIKEITDKINSEVHYYKLNPSKKIMDKYSVKELPSLLIFKEGKFLGKIVGYYNIEQKEAFREAIDKILK